jgi:hypothetical protein
MIDMLTTFAAAAGSSSEAFDGLKHFVNRISVPEFSLPLFTLLFIAMLVFYRQWTRPVVFTLIMIVFCVLYFGAMAIDHNYLLIVAKADNVPITLMLLATLYTLWLAFRQAAINDANIEAGRPLIEEGKDDKVLVWPDLVYTEMICIVIASAVLVLWAVALPAPLESPANPAGPPNPSKAPWYFLGLQEMLVYFDPWMAGVILPGLIVTGLIAMPYIDTNPKGNGYYTFKQRPFAISTWLFGFLILWIVLIVFGTFLRGPNWNFFGPFEYWDSHLTVPLTNINLSEYVWLYILKQPLPSNPMVREFVGIILTLAWIFVLPVLLAKTVMRRMFDQMGSLRFYILAIHLVVMAMLPVKMVLRWLLTLKYFINLPEFNLNL